MSVCYILGTQLHLRNFILESSLRDYYKHYQFQFTEEETVSQRGEETSPTGKGVFRLSHDSWFILTTGVERQRGREREQLTSAFIPLNGWAEADPGCWRLNSGLPHTHCKGPTT